MTASGRKGPRKELLNAMFRLKAATFGRCFAPPSLCEQPPIHAHAVQNARVLDLLAADGHVVAPTIRIDAKTGPQFDLGSVSRNRATTFAGLCAEHDRRIFAPIETELVDLRNPEHLFLLAYRATLFETHATAAKGWLIQMAYQERVKLGLDPKDAPSVPGLLATEHLIVAYETFQYKLCFDEPYLARAFDAVEHDVMLLDVKRPTLAASALFSTDNVRRGDDVVRACITVLPITRVQTAVILSYLRPDAQLARQQLADVLQADTASLPFAVSRRLLNNCQNFALSPEYVHGWPPGKQEAITTYFSRTVFENDLATDDPHLVLFD
jgi:hypothetical protein